MQGLQNTTKLNKWNTLLETTFLGGQKDIRVSRDCSSGVLGPSHARDGNDRRQWSEEGRPPEIVVWVRPVRGNSYITVRRTTLFIHP